MKSFALATIIIGASFQLFSSNDNSNLGAKSIALADASSTLSDVWSAQNNQAGLGFVREFSVGFAYNNQFLLKELGTKSGAVAIPVKGGTFGLLLSSFGYNLYNENKYSLSFAKAFGDNLSMGIALDYLNTHIADNYGNKSVILGEFGIQSKPTEALIIGAHIYNPTRAKFTDYNNERIPTIIKVGGSYRFSESVFLSVETEKDISQKMILKSGLEYEAMKGFFLRVGVSSNPLLSSFGVGFNLKRFQIDLASNYNPSLGFSPQVSIQYVHSSKSKKV